MTVILILLQISDVRIVANFETLITLQDRISEKLTKANKLKQM